MPRVLSEHGRNDNRDQIGGAVAHLNRTLKIHKVGRGQWVLGPDPEKAPGDTVPAVSPGPVAATRSGGDEDETAPSLYPTVPQDHDPASSERDDRDHHRLADDRVAVQF